MKETIFLLFPFLQPIHHDFLIWKDVRSKSKSSSFVEDSFSCKDDVLSNGYFLFKG